MRYHMRRDAVSGVEHVSDSAQVLDDTTIATTAQCQSKPLTLPLLREMQSSWADGVGEL